VRADAALQAAAYGDPSLPVSPLLVKAVAGFLRNPAPSAD